MESSGGIGGPVRLDVDLAEEGFDWRNYVILHVKSVVVHAIRSEELAVRTAASNFQSNTVLDANNSVFWPVDDQHWASDFLNQLDVAEALGEKEAQQVADPVSGYLAQ